MVGTRFSVLYETRNFTANGTMKVRANVAPIAKKSVDSTTKGNANFRSCGRRPGDTNAQIS